MQKYIYFHTSHWLTAEVETVLVNTDHILYVDKAKKHTHPPSVLNEEQKKNYEDKANSVINLPGYNLRVTETIEEIEKMLNMESDFG